MIGLGAKFTLVMPLPLYASDVTFAVTFSEPGLGHEPSFERVTTPLPSLYCQCRRRKPSLVGAQGN
ncbi:hypothetical protein CSB45_02435 [candidate division KSB3 bacterium]|uniref:Uncharacterized protein n=1 Tax=candidate division KSB3 bacterium TaxID=2044937 RepID=A0A2G6EA91_9BACT|nr:MAG: hypothetical protein CSB45_02435 [candidate division KSB3 bacterium]PIE30939.1 MAG: hypothetical protein CSA57_01050 [candidate division KSB3 bacterium]